MRDPRIDELLRHLDEVNTRGNPTRAAAMAAEVNSYLVELEKLRSEVEIASRQVVYLSGREAALRQALTPRSNGSAAVAVAAGAGGDPVESTLSAHSSLSRLADDEPDFEFQKERLETVITNLQARRQFVKRIQDLIAMRVNTVQKLLDTYAKMQSKAIKPVVRVRRRRIRRIRRRR